MKNITTIGVDIAKNYIQVHGAERVQILDPCEAMLT